MRVWTLLQEIIVSVGLDVKSIQSERNALNTYIKLIINQNTYKYILSIFYCITSII